LSLEVRVLGPSGLRVSRLCLGTATFGNREWGCDESEGRNILDRYLDAGGNFLDCANKYADGESELVLGRILQGRRDRVVVGTKYTGTLDDTDLNASGNHRKSLVRSLDRSLRSLQTDYLDILWVHAWDGVTPIDVLMRALDDQVRAGKVLSAGISNAPAWMISYAQAVAASHGWSSFTAVQNEYSLLQRGPERDLLPMSSYLGMGYVAWAPFAQGRLTGKYSSQSKEPKRLSAEEARMSEAQDTVVRATLEVAKEIDAAPTAVALRWMMQHQPQVIPIIGARTIEQYEANMRCLEIDLSDTQMKRLNSVSAIDLGSPTTFMRGEPGRDFMWGRARTVPSTTAQPTRPWWEL
jgi:aryl-alcohol dehydrogenase-like predicted oxidoreductase